MFEILSTIFGLTQGALVMFNKRSNWIFYIMQMVAMVIFSWQASLYGDVCLDAMYICFGIAGWFAWKSEDMSKVTKVSASNLLGWSIIGILIFSISAIMLEQTNDPLPILDSATTVFSFIATVWMVQHKLESWILWLLDDILYCIQYFMLPEQAWWLFGLNLLWCGMAIGSYINWYKSYKESI